MGGRGRAQRKRRGGERQRLSLHAVVVVLLLHPVLARAVTCGDTVVGALTLTADLVCPGGHGLLLGSGAALDCAGHSISGESQPGQYGIYLRDLNDATVRNCRVLQFEVGIRLRGAVGCAVYDNVSQDNTRYGIEVTQSSARALLFRNQVNTNGDEGVHLSGPADADADHQLLENTLDGNAREGIYLLGSQGSIIAGNTVQNHGAAGIYVKDSRRNTIADNVLRNDPIQLVLGSELNVLVGNAVIGNSIKFDGASQNHVYSSSVQEQDGRPSSAFVFSGSSDNRIVDTEAFRPVDYHIKATGSSTGNVFARFLAVPELRCSIDGDSSVTVTDPGGSPLPCEAIGGTSTTTTSSTTTTTLRSTTTSTTIPPPTTHFERQVMKGSDDAEERVSNGRVGNTSSDLEMAFDKVGQIVGIRFTGVAIPRGATIKQAHIQFTVDEKGAGGPPLRIRGEANATTFVETDFDISDRLGSVRVTTAAVTWTPPDWNSTGAAGVDQRTADIRSVIQEIVNRNDWASNGAIAILITGETPSKSNSRIAESYDGVAASAPVLRVEYNLP